MSSVLYWPRPTGWPYRSTGSVVAEDINRHSAVVDLSWLKLWNCLVFVLSLQGKEGMKGIQGPPGLPGLMVRNAVDKVL